MSGSRRKTQLNAETFGVSVSWNSELKLYIIRDSYSGFTVSFKRRDQAEREFNRAVNQAARAMFKREGLRAL